MHRGLVIALRARGVEIATVHEAGMIQASDAAQLEWAAHHGFVLLSHNVGDFAKLHRDWLASGREHSGILLEAHEQYAIGDTLRRLLNLRQSLTSSQMRSRIEYLSNWTKRQA